jgi:hypothetical protein
VLHWGLPHAPPLLLRHTSQHLLLLLLLGWATVSGLRRQIGAQHSTAQHSTAQHSTAQHSTAQQQQQ